MVAAVDRAATPGIRATAAALGKARRGLIAGMA
jgi:hypothetical protein